MIRLEPISCMKVTTSTSFQHHQKVTRSTSRPNLPSTRASNRPVHLKRRERGLLNRWTFHFIFPLNHSRVRLPRDTALPHTSKNEMKIRKIEKNTTKNQVRTTKLQTRTSSIRFDSSRTSFYFFLSFFLSVFLFPHSLIIEQRAFVSHHMLAFSP
jgi:hypothetical protein